MNISTALVQRPRESQMQLVRGSLSDPAPGRTPHQVYSHLGDHVERHANRVAHRSGRGPCATADRIADFFGTGSEREAKLEALPASECHWIETECSKLVEYTLPHEAAGTQIQAFKCIVTIVTRYHGTRALFLKSRHLRRAAHTKAAICAVWARADDAQSRKWKFFCAFAATCLSDNDISKILENRCLGSFDTESGHLSVIKCLLIASECSASSISDALAQRYLAGILELPIFWRENGPLHLTIFTKILKRVVRILKDLGLESESNEDDKTGAIFDNDGIDAMTAAVLLGILSWCTPDPESQSWYRRLAEIVRLLRLPQAEVLLPTSSSLAAGLDMRNIIPDPVPEIDMFIMAVKTKIRQTNGRKPRKEVPGNGPTATTKARAWVLGRLRNFFPRRRRPVYSLKTGTAPASEPASRTFNIQSGPEHCQTILNNVAQKNGWVISYHGTWTGPQTNPRWTCIAYLNNIEYGRGIESSKGSAKASAARNALVALGVLPA